MEIVEPGHIYRLSQLDGRADQDLLVFVAREGDRNGPEHPGTQTQDVLRALIDRTQHCDACLRWPGNDLIVYHLRMALVLHEARALERKVEKGILQPEQIMVGPDGHFALHPVMPDPKAAPSGPLHIEDKEPQPLIYTDEQMQREEKNRA